MSPQHLLQARAAARPCYASLQCRGTCCHGLLRWQQKKRRAKKRAQRRTMGATGAGMTEKIITVSSLPRGIIPLLSCGYTIPPKHLIFAQLLICAPSFSCLLYLPFQQPRFTCCCRDYPARQASRFLLLKQLFALFVLNTAIKESLNIFCVSLPSFIGLHSH